MLPQIFILNRPSIQIGHSTFCIGLWLCFYSTYIGLNMSAIGKVWISFMELILTHTKFVIQLNVDLLNSRFRLSILTTNEFEFVNSQWNRILSWFNLTWLNNLDLYVSNLNYIAAIHQAYTYDRRTINSSLSCCIEYLRSYDTILSNCYEVLLVCLVVTKYIVLHNLVLNAHTKWSKVFHNRATCRTLLVNTYECRQVELTIVSNYSINNFLLLSIFAPNKTVLHLSTSLGILNTDTNCTTTIVIILWS